VAAAQRTDRDAPRGRWPARCSDGHGFGTRADVSSVPVSAVSDTERSHSVVFAPVYSANPRMDGARHADGSIDRRAGCLAAAGYGGRRAVTRDERDWALAPGQGPLTLTVFIPQKTSAPCLGPPGVVRSRGSVGHP
jgi:hypothetical protein